MSDADLLDPQPIEFQPLPGGKTWAFAVCDLATELLYQSRHQAWARNQFEAMRGSVSAQSHEADLDRFVQQVSANRFAFGGPLSLAFLLSSEGAAEYLALLASKAGCKAASKSAIEALRRRDKGSYDAMLLQVLRRDFPNHWPPPPEGDSSSPEAATPSPSTTDSTSSSRGETGECPPGGSES